MVTPEPPEPEPPEEPPPEPGLCIGNVDTVILTPVELEALTALAELKKRTRTEINITVLNVVIDIPYRPSSAVCTRIS